MKRVCVILLVVMQGKVMIPLFSFVLRKNLACILGLSYSFVFCSANSLWFGADECKSSDRANSMVIT